MPRRLPVALSCATVVALATTALSTLAPSPARAEDPTLDPTSYELDVIVNTGYLPPAPSPGAPAGPAADAALPSANGLDVAADGTIYLSSFLLGRIATLTPDGDGGYDLDYVAGAGGFGPASPYPTGTPAATSPLSPAVLTVDPEGGVYFYDNAAGVVYRLETDGTLTHIAGVGGTRTSPGNGPYGAPTATPLRLVDSMGVGPGGDLYFIVESRVVAISDPGTPEATMTRVTGGLTTPATPDFDTPVPAATASFTPGSLAADAERVVIAAAAHGVLELVDGALVRIAGGGADPLGDAPAPALTVMLNAAGSGGAQMALAEDGTLYYSATPSGGGMIELLPGDPLIARRITQAAPERVVPGPALASPMGGVQFPFSVDPTTASVIASVALRNSPAQVIRIRTLFAPAAVSAVAGVAEATVTVTPPTRGRNPEKYTVTASPGDGSCTVTVTEGEALSCTVPGLTPGVGYSFDAVSQYAAASTEPTATEGEVVPLAPAPADTDGDGLTDAEEEGLGTDPRRKDTDGDRLADGVEVRGIVVPARIYIGAGPDEAGRAIGRVRTSPLRRDTDGDGLGDRRELRGTRLDQVVRARDGRYTIGLRVTNPVSADTDGDGLTDRQEITGSANTRHGRARTDPTRADTDRSGMKDGREVERGFDPTRF